MFPSDRTSFQKVEGRLKLWEGGNYGPNTSAEVGGSSFFQNAGEGEEVKYE